MKSRKKVQFNEIDNELIGGQSVELLKALHLLTPDGNLNADARRKLKQVNHLVHFVRPILERETPLTVVDLGSGKSYLGFVIYDLFFKNVESRKVISVETRPELVSKAQKLAAELGFTRMEFVEGSIADFQFPEKADLVVALHACDVATDLAIVGAVKQNAQNLLLVPCCQAEVSRQLNKIKNENIGALWRHGIHSREFGSQITNVVRGLVLESLGYKVSVTELVGWEHSLKNELILAQKVQGSNSAARSQLDNLLKSIPIAPTCLKALQ